MKKKYMKMLLLAVSSTALLATSAMGAPLGNLATSISGSQDGSGTTLQDLINDSGAQNDIHFSGFTSDVTADQYGAGLWTTAESDVSAWEIVYLGGSGTGTLSIYDTFGNIEELVLDASGEGGFSFVQDLVTGETHVKIDGVVSTEVWSTTFGFAFEGSGYEQWYTEDDKNSDLANHMASFLIPDGTDWQAPSTDGTVLNSGTLLGDNDWLIAFNINDTDTGTGDYQDAVFLLEDMNAVPEPTTMLLFGTGLAGLAGVARRRRK